MILAAPGPLARRVDAAARRLLQAEGEAVDFSAPAGEAALAGPDSVSWRVFKNPVSLYVGGVAAVLLEFAEPLVRSGVWEHSSFRTDPLGRLRRTGLAAMVTVYGARSRAEAMIAGVRAKHARIAGTTPCGRPYRADDPQLLTWVQATAAFGFLAAYDTYVTPVAGVDQDRYYAEGRVASALYGATTAPASRAELGELFEGMRPGLEASPVVLEFLDIMSSRPLLPAPLRPAQAMLARAAVEITPPWARGVLGLGEDWRLRGWERRLIRLAAGLAERTFLPAHPAAQACRRLGLPEDYLFRGRARALTGPPPAPTEPEPEETRHAPRRHR